jgi:hypothetical protein
LDFIVRSIAALPEKANRIWCVAWGIACVVFAAAVIAGVRYNAIFDDWGIVYEKKGDSMVQKMVSEARRDREPPDESLEDSINDFVGDADADAAL